MKRIKHAINQVLGHFGYVINARKRLDPVRNRLFEEIISNGITIVFDVGANIGQFALELRRQGFKGKIISIEPVKAAFEQLRLAARKDMGWYALNIALGAERMSSEINISKNTWSSSIRPLEERIIDIEPSVEYVATESIQMDTFDNIVGDYVGEKDRIFLKLDVQGFENEVLHGARKSIHLIEGILSEASLSSNYKGEWLLQDLTEYLSAKGFTLFDLRDVFRNAESGQLLQMDALFWRSGELEASQ